MKTNLTLLLVLASFTFLGAQEVSIEELREQLCQLQMNENSKKVIPIIDSLLTTTNLNPEKRTLLFIKKGVELTYIEKAEQAFQLLDSIKNELDISHDTISSFYIETLMGLANVAMISRNFDKSEALYLQALNLPFSNAKTDSLLLASCQNNIGVMYKRTDSYSKAIEYYQRSLAVKVKILGATHPSVAVSLNNIGDLYLKQRNLKEAEHYFKQTHEIRSKTLSEGNNEYLNSLSSLSQIYRLRGHYQKAEKLALKNFELSKKYHGKESRVFVNSANSLAVLNLAIGNYKKANEYYDLALPVVEKLVGKNHPFYATILHNMGNIYIGQREYKFAQSKIKEAIAIDSSRLGIDNLKVAGGFKSLADTYYQLKNYESADFYYRKCLSIFRRLTNEKGITYNGIRLHLARSLYRQNQNDHALALVDSIMNNVNLDEGEEFPLYHSLLMFKSKINLQKGNYTEAAQSMVASMEEKKIRIANAFKYLSESEKSSFLSAYLADADLLKILGAYSKDPDLHQTIFNTSQFEKGILLHSSNLLRSYIYNSTDQVAINLFNELEGKNRELHSMEKVNSQKANETVALRNEIEKMEKKLAERSTDFRSELNKKISDANYLLNNLAENELVVEFLRFNKSIDKEENDYVYAASILDPANKNIYFKELTSEINLIEAFYNDSPTLAISESKLDRGLKPNQKNQRKHNTFTNYKELYDLIWKPLESIIQSKDVVHYSPVGMLNKINLKAVWHDIDTSSAQPQLVRVLSTRNLNSSPNNEQLNSIVLFGGIDYDRASTLDLELKGLEESLGEPMAINVERSQREISEKWNYLPGTEAEIGHILETCSNHNFEVNQLKGSDATESEFKKLGALKPSPKVIHLATHGFFIPIEGGSSEVTLNQNPLLNSGLILAGANRKKELSADMETREDGILTSFEISNLNLSNTKLVLMSACETGLGEIKGNEGVFGLQRAFKMAGVDKLIMSLWKIPDVETSEFMSHFYEEWLNNNLTINRAFERTQIAMKEKHIDPFYWAGFILLE